MNILVIGAGVLGSVYAAHLARAGQKVTILARGQRLNELQQQGIILENQTTGERSVTQVDVIETLDEDDVFDLVLVLVRKEQVAELLPLLAANKGTPRILFMVNNAAGPFEMIQSLGRERVLLGFPGAGGIRQDGIVRYSLSEGRFQPTMIGEITGVMTPRLYQIAAIFEGAGLPTRISRHMDAWLKTHVAIVSPIANAIYMAGGSTIRLSHTRDGLVLLVRAVREGFDVLSAMGQPVTPFYYRLLFSQPEPILVWILSWIFSTPQADLVMASHANHARGEMTLLYQEFLNLARTTSVKTPSIETLGMYCVENRLPEPEGSRKIRVFWEEVAYVIAGINAAIGLIYLIKKIKTRWK